MGDEVRLRTAGLGASRHPLLYCAGPRFWYAPGIRVQYLKPIGLAWYAPGLNLPYVRKRGAGEEWSAPVKAFRLLQPVQMPLTEGGVSLEILGIRERRESVLYSTQVEYRDWDIYLVLIHSAGRAEQRWLGRDHWIQEGWVSECRWTSHVLRRARAWGSRA